MTLADILTDPANLAGLTDADGARRCKVGRILDTLPQRDATALHDALDLDTDPRSRAWSAMRLAKVITAAGNPVGEKAIAQHRSRICICSNYDNPKDADQ